MIEQDLSRVPFHSLNVPNKGFEVCPMRRAMIFHRVSLAWWSMVRFRAKLGHSARPASYDEPNGACSRHSQLAERIVSERMEKNAASVSATRNDKP